MNSILQIFFLALIFSQGAQAADPCLGSQEREVCLRMNSLRAQIHALDAQRELMQSNSAYIEALGRSLNQTALDTLKMMGPGIPEHRTGLAKVAKMGEDMAYMAVKNDPRMMTLANQVRINCATCHSNPNPPNGVDWDTIFSSDWTKISEYCNSIGKNPYFCKSMNGMLSAFSYHLTSYNANIRDFAMTQQASQEIARILVDIKEKNFPHLQPKAWDDAQAAAIEVAQLAADKNPMVFEKAYVLNQRCTECHNQAREDNRLPAFSRASKLSVFR